MRPTDRSSEFRNSRGAWPVARRYALWLSLLLVGVGATIGGAAEPDPLAIDDFMLRDPSLIIYGWDVKFAPKLKPLWMAALTRPDAEAQRLAADTMTLAAQRGMPGLEEATPALLGLVKSHRDAAVRRSAARALVTLDARAAAAELAAAAPRDGLLMAQIVEPALAKWDFAGMRPIWLERLKDPYVERDLLRLAVEGLATVGEEKAVDRLLAFVHDVDAAPDQRLAAARAAGHIRASGLTAEANKLLEGASPSTLQARLLAVHLLARHQDATSVAILKRLAIDQEPAVATAALRSLYAADRAAALELARAALSHRDAGLRQAAAPMVADQVNVAAVKDLGPLLGDRNPTLRRWVARKLTEFGGREELKAEVIAQAMAVLAGDQWRGLEQAALVLAALDHKPAAPRMAELLPHPRGEVGVAVAWGLRKLQVPETCPPALQYAEKLHQGMSSGGAPLHAGKQASQIFQLFGIVGYRESEPLLRKFVPKSTALDSMARGAACWTLGHFYTGQPDNDLVPQFVQRLSDVDVPLPEFGIVRRMTAIGLGRMKAESQLAVLRKFAQRDGLYDETGLACYWSIEQLTGEKMPESPPRSIGVAGWFLEPLDDK